MKQTPASRADSPAVSAPKPICHLTGGDGNVFAIIGRVRRALRTAGLGVEAQEFVDKAFQAGSYNEVLQLCMEYVEVR